MRFRALFLPLVLLVTLAKTACGEEPRAPSPTADPLLCLPVTSMKGRGSSVPIGPFEVLTAAHGVQPHFELFGNQTYLVPTAAADIRVGGQPARLESFSSDDSVAVRLKIQVQLPRWLPTAEARLGEAFVLRPTSVHRVEITNLDSRVFKGWLPFRGCSGSAVVQRFEGTWKVVGVIQGYICDSCHVCFAGTCHCLVGAYSNTPVVEKPPRRAR